MESDKESGYRERRAPAMTGGPVNREESKVEVRELLNRYVSIQRKMVEMEAEKKQLREKLDPPRQVLANGYGCYRACRGGRNSTAAGHANS